MIFVRGSAAGWSVARTHRRSGDRQVEADSRARCRASRTSPMLGGTDFTTQTSNSNVADHHSLSLDPWEQRQRAESAIDRDPRASADAHSPGAGGVAFAFGLPPILGLEHRPADSSSCWRTAPAAILQQLARCRAGADRRGSPASGTGRNMISTFPRGCAAIQGRHGYSTKAQTLGIPVTDVYNALQTFLGGLYVNDFNRFGHTWQVSDAGRAGISRSSRPTSIGSTCAPATATWCRWARWRRSSP